MLPLEMADSLAPDTWNLLTQNARASLLDRYAKSVVVSAIPAVQSSSTSKSGDIIAQARRIRPREVLVHEKL
jgi:hypothetical protein